MQEEKNVIISVKNLSKNYSTLVVLKNINLEVRRGEVIAIIGPSGSGKSTMLRCMNALETISGGEIYYKGEPISTRKKYTKLREEVGMVFQHFNLFSHMTVLENVMYAPVKVKKRNKGTVYMEAMDILEVVGLAEKKDVYPEMLSGGQKQRVAIARALAKNPKLLLCDEPTGALDYNTGKQILKLLQDTCRERGVTVVVITHNLALTAMGDKVIKVKNGVVDSVTVNESPLPIEQIEW